jgi:hypothetical protein
MSVRCRGGTMIIDVEVRDAGAKGTGVLRYVRFVTIGGSSRRAHALPLEVGVRRGQVVRF